MFIGGDERNLRKDRKKERVEQKITVVFIKMLKQNCATLLKVKEMRQKGLISVIKPEKEGVWKGFGRNSEGVKWLSEGVGRDGRGFL